MRLLSVACGIHLSLQSQAWEALSLCVYVGVGMGVGVFCVYPCPSK